MNHIVKEVNFVTKQQKQIYVYYLNESKAAIADDQKASAQNTTSSKRAEKQYKDGVCKPLTN